VFVVVVAEVVESIGFEKLDLDNVIHQHIAYYEKLYEWFNDMKNYTGIRRALQAKERLLGLHSQTNTLTINQENIFQTQRVDDFSQLSKIEQKRLKELIKKCTP
jgi:hypothetical protein